MTKQPTQLLQFSQPTLSQMAVGCGEHGCRLSACIPPGTSDGADDVHQAKELTLTFWSHRMAPPIRRSIDPFWRSRLRGSSLLLVLLLKSPVHARYSVPKVAGARFTDAGADLKPVDYDGHQRVFSQNNGF